MRPALLSALILAAPLSGARALGSGYAGTSAAEFLKLGADARGVAMGEAMAAVADDANAIYWNPAGLAAAARRHLSLTHSILFQSVFYDFLAYAHPVRPLVPTRRREIRSSGLGTLAAAVLYLNAGELQEFDRFGAKTGGAFTPQDFAFIGGWGGALTDSLDVGVSLKYIDSRIKATARTGAIDAGARYRTHLGPLPLTLAVNGRNYGGALKFRNQQDPLPASVRLAAALRPAPFWVIAAEGVFPRDNDPYTSLGSEMAVPLDLDVTVVLRGGWSGRTSSGDLEGMAGVSFGAGLGLNAMRVDYAWVPFGLLGNTHRFTLGYRF